MRTPVAIITLVFLVATVGVFFLVKGATVTGQASHDVPMVVLPQQDQGASILQQSTEAISQRYKGCITSVHTTVMARFQTCMNRCINLAGPQPDIQGCAHHCIAALTNEHLQGMNTCEQQRYAPRITIIRQ